MEKNTPCVPGDSEAFDVLANYEAVHKYAGDEAALFEITAYKVEADGTLNLEAPYKPMVVYWFVRPASPSAAKAEKAPYKIGTGMASSRRQPKPDSHEQVTVTIGKTHRMRITKNGSQTNQLHGGMARRVYSTFTAKMPTAIPPPHCSFGSLWQKAIAQGVPRNAVAEIHYELA